MLPVSDSIAGRDRKIQSFAGSVVKCSATEGGCAPLENGGVTTTYGARPGTGRCAEGSQRNRSIYMGGFVMIKFTTVLCFAIASLACFPALNAEARERHGPTRYYDQRGQDRGYEWCFRRGRENSWNCNYYTWQQCREAALGELGYCERNPWAINPRG